METDSRPRTRVLVRLFGDEAVAAGRDVIEVDLEGVRPTVADLRRAVLARGELLCELGSAMRFAVNHAYSCDSDTVSGSDEIAIIGRVSGG